VGRLLIGGPKVRKIFTVKAMWDKDAGVYYSESDITGLHIEADNLEDFEKEVLEYAAELVVANHITDEELRTSQTRDVIPAILYRGAFEKAM
jgi:hypothetical protein